MAMQDKLKALEENQVWKLTPLPAGAHCLHTKWVYKTKRDANGNLERFKARLVACGNEQVYGRDYNLTFAAVMDMSSVKLILALARKWGVPAKHGDIPNAYVKAEKEPDLRIFLRTPQGMDIKQSKAEGHKDCRLDDMGLELQKALYGLKQAGRLWSELLHEKLKSFGYVQCLTDMCVYFKRVKTKLVVVGVYVDDLLVTGTNSEDVDKFFEDLKGLSVKNLGTVSKFLGMRVKYSRDGGYLIDQEVTIREMLNENGLEHARGVRTPIGDGCNDPELFKKDLPLDWTSEEATKKKFQSLVGSLLWLASCSRPDISYAVHQATRRTHCPTEGGWKVAKRIARYLQGSKNLTLIMDGKVEPGGDVNIVGYSDADFAADKADRKSLTGDWITVDGMPVTWVAKKQTGVSLSTAEAEFTAASVIVTQMLGLRELIQEMGVRCVEPMLLYVDNQAALKQLEGEGASMKSKHVDVRIKFVYQHVKNGIILPKYLPSEVMPADLMTKAMASPRLEELKLLVGLKSSEDARRTSA